MKWPTPDWSQAGWVYKAIKYTATRPVKAVCRVHARGQENLPTEGGAIVVVNHWSWWDPILVADVLPRPLVHLAKKEVFANPVTRYFFETGAGQIPVDRQRGGNDDALERASQAIAKGRVVAIYPEGTRSMPPDLLPGKTGVARLALHTGAPVVPVGCLSDRFWNKTRLTPKFGERVYVHVGAPLRFGPDAAAAEDRGTTRKITDDLMAEVRRLLDEAAAARDRGEDWPWRPLNGRLFGREAT